MVLLRKGVTVNLEGIKKRFFRIIHFGFSSVWTQLVDVAVFSAVCLPVEKLGGRTVAILLAVPTAKLASGHCCFYYNLWFVFKDKFSWRAYVSFWGLVAINAVLLIGCTEGASFLFDATGFQISLINFIATVALWFCSFLVQEFWIFNRHAQFGGRGKNTLHQD